MFRIVDKPLTLDYPPGHHLHCLVCQIPNHIGREGSACRLIDPEPQWAQVRSILDLVLAAEGNLSAAARAFAGFPFHDEEIAVADEAGYFEAAGRYVPSLLNLLQQAMTQEGPVPDDPAILGAIKAPVAVLLGLATKPFFTTSARHVVDHVANARVHEIPGAAHAAPVTHPEALAGALLEFFASSPEVQLQH